MQSITFDVDSLVRDLNVITQVQLPFLAALTVNRLANATKAGLRREMLDSFERVSPFTLRSLEQVHLATKAEPWTTIQHWPYGAKGNAPANYLRPQITGGPVFKTRFQGRLNRELQDYMGAYMQPLEDSPAAKLNAQGRVKASQYVEALYGIKAMESLRASGRPGKYKTEGAYKYMPYLGISSSGKKVRGGNAKRRLLKPGIYRKIGFGYERLFMQLQDVPTVSPRYDFKFAAENIVNKNVQSIFDKAFSDTLGRKNI
jgi:hypothetical protein